jgi:hypothetical protein
VGFQTVYDAVSAALQYVAASRDNTRKLQDSGTPDTYPPMYVWEPRSIEYGDEKGPGENWGTRNPKALQLDAHVWDVACWGATRTDCERMRLALMRAVRDAGFGPGGCEFGSATWAYPEWSRNGYALVQSMTVYVPAVSVEVPTATGTSIPETDVANDVIETVSITAVDPRDATDAVEGDGILQGGEE